MSALLAAWEAGIEWCECDVQFLAGGEPVVMHDETMERMTGRAGRVGEMGVGELKGYFLVGTDESPPLLGEVLGRMPGRGKLMIEVKPAVVTRQFFEVIGRVAPERVMVQSFHEAVLREMGSVEVAHLIDDAGVLESSPWGTLHVDYKLLSEDVVRKLIGRGKKLGAWTVNDAREAERLVDLGVETIISDMPPGIGGFGEASVRGRGIPGSRKSGG